MAQWSWNRHATCCWMYLGKLRKTTTKKQQQNRKNKPHKTNHLNKQKPTEISQSGID